MRRGGRISRKLNWIGAWSDMSKLRKKRKPSGLDDRCLAARTDIGEVQALEGVGLFLGALTVEAAAALTMVSPRGGGKGNPANRTRTAEERLVRSGDARLAKNRDEEGQAVIQGKLVAFVEERGARDRLAVDEEPAGRWIEEGETVLAGRGTDGIEDQNVLVRLRLNSEEFR